jgi:hypothetical protein
MRRRAFLASLPALLSSTLAAENRQFTSSKALRSQQAVSVTPQIMRAAWESLTWGGFSGQALVVDVGLPWRLISWEKAQYLPCWEVQKGLWFFSEFLETAGTAALERGSHEPLSDKHNRYTHVSISELGPARIILHWQYALTDSTEQANIFHGNTWAEEFHTIYPDGLTVRKLVGYPGNENRAQGQPVVWEVAELDLVFAPGANLNATIDRSSALRVSAGDKHSYILSWPSAGERWLCQRNPQSCDWPAYVFRPSLRRQPEPFLIVPNRKDYFPRIACGACGGDHLATMLWLEPGIYRNWPGCSGECPKIVKGTEEDMKANPVHMPFVSVIPWVHPSFLTNFLTRGDRSSASSVSFDPNWGPKPGTTWLMLFGASKEDDRYLGNVANQWVNPPQLEMREGESKGFEASENLYTVAPGAKGCAFRIVLANNKPLAHPTFKILNWGYRPARVSLNGTLLARERWRGSWIRNNLVVWIGEVLTAASEIRIETF